MAVLAGSSQQVKVSRYQALVRQLKAGHFIAVLTVILLALAVLVHFFGVLEIDVAATRIIQSVRTPTLDRVAQVITMAGNAGTLVVAAIVAALYFLRIKLWRSSVIVLLSSVAYPLNVAIKDIVDRVRPTSQLVKIVSPAGGYSFPSGHAMVSMAVYGCIAYLLWTHVQTARRWLIPIVAAVLILLIGLSRIYLGVHWFSDVFGGWIAGLVVLLVLGEIHRRWAVRQ